MLGQRLIAAFFDQADRPLRLSQLGLTLSDLLQAPFNPHHDVINLTLKQLSDRKCFLCRPHHKPHGFILRRDRNLLLPLDNLLLIGFSHLPSCDRIRIPNQFSDPPCDGIYPRHDDKQDL
ncbi:MAG: hypothetical protein AAFY57_18410 [Cyanobacteria bacterium J06642_2]